METVFDEAKPVSVRSYYAGSTLLKLPSIAVYDPEIGDYVHMAHLIFMGLRWEVCYWDTTNEDEQEEPPKYAYFDTYEEAMEFMTVRQVLARML